VSNTNKTWRATATVRGGKFLGEIEAPTADEALDQAEQLGTMHVSLCHQCSDECEDAEVVNVTVERQDSDGEWVTLESEPDEAPALRAKVADFEKQVAALGEPAALCDAACEETRRFFGRMMGALRALAAARAVMEALPESCDGPEFDAVDAFLDSTADVAARFVDVDSDEMRDLLQDAAHEGRMSTVGVHQIADILITAFKGRRKA
jgi:hypothetical protein